MDKVLVSQQGSIATITLNRPEVKNAIDDEMWDSLHQTFRALGYDEDVRVVVLTGAGGEFSSGADVGRIARDRTRHPLQSMRNVGDVCLALHDMPKPTVARVEGVAVGAGANLALCCDLIVAADTARFSEIFARRGLSLDFGGSWLLPRIVGMHKAKELALLAEIISAKEAAEIGLVNKVVPASELDAAVEDWTARLAAGPPVALGQSKVLLNKSFENSLAEALLDESRAQALNLQSDDAKEAAAAWVDKREPDFQGR